jgi:hypothetical protein
MIEIMYILQPILEERETVVVTRDGRITILSGKMPETWMGREVEEQIQSDGNLYLWVFSESRHCGQNLGEIVNRSETNHPEVLK